MFGLADRHGAIQELDGQSSSSREPPGSSPVTVNVVVGDVVAQHAPWLDKLYRSELMERAGSHFGLELAACEDLRAAVNVNDLRGEGARYERHVDTNPLTGLMFVNSLGPGEGGELVFERPLGDIRIVPREGLFLAFDARDTVHYVTPLKGRHARRVSIPMNYYLKGQPQVRPQDLDPYLYRRER